MKIKYWSDFACPFCYIGMARMKKAMAHACPDAELEMLSFELDPYAPKRSDKSVLEIFSEKYGLSAEDAGRQIDTISEMGRAEGLDFSKISTLYPTRCSR